MKTLNSLRLPLLGLGRVAIPLALVLLTLGACKKKAEVAPVVRPVRSIVVEKREVKDPKVVSGHLRAAGSRSGTERPKLRPGRCRRGPSLA